MRKKVEFYEFCLLAILVFPLAVFSKARILPQRIISLGPQITEEIYLLKADDKIVGNTSYCIRPEEAKQKEKVGDVININLEKIISLKPDLILATGLTAPKYIEKLKDLGFRVEIFYQPISFDGICMDFIKLGRLLGKEKEARNIVDISKKRVGEVLSITKKLSRKKVFVQIGINPLFTVNKDSFINDFIELAGGINIAKSSLSGIYSHEAVVNSDPEVIIIAPMGLDGKEEIREWKKYPSIKAVKDERIFIIDSYTLCSPTPVTFVETLWKIAKFIHSGINLDNIK